MLVPSQRVPTRGSVHFFIGLSSISCRECILLAAGGNETEEKRATSISSLRVYSAKR